MTEEGHVTLTRSRGKSYIPTQEDYDEAMNELVRRSKSRE